MGSRPIIWVMTSPCMLIYMGMIQGALRIWIYIYLGAPRRFIKEVFRIRAVHCGISCLRGSEAKPTSHNETRLLMGYWTQTPHHQRATVWIHQYTCSLLNGCKAICAFCDLVALVESALHSLIPNSELDGDNGCFFIWHWYICEDRAVLWYPMTQIRFMHYVDVIMTTVASQFTSLAAVYSIVYSGADERKHQSSASLAFVRGIHRDRWIPRTKGQLRGKCIHLMTSSWVALR